MTEGFSRVINQLQRQKTAIEQALAALRGIESTPAPSTTPERTGDTQGRNDPGGANTAIGGTEKTMGREESGGKRA